MSTRVSARAIPLLLVALSACATRDDKAADSLSASPAPPGAASNRAPADTDQVALTELGYEPLRAGMSFAAANDSLRGALKAAPNANLGECEYVTWEGGPSGLMIMVLENRIARIETTDTSVFTATGARVGDTEDRIKSLYADRLTVEPHKYSDGHYLVVKAADARDSLHLLVFETDGKNVISMRGGIMPGIRFVEGCS